jgi:hypothetical protein
MGARHAALLMVVALLAWVPSQALEAERTPVAIIVNASNHAPDPSLTELRAILTLERQFWPGGDRVVLVLPRSGSPERETLLSRIYGTSESGLRKRWVEKLFAGQIPAIPSVAPSAARAAALVQQSPGAIAAVNADEVPAGVRVLAIDGKKTGERGYPLSMP